MRFIDYDTDLLKKSAILAAGSALIAGISFIDWMTSQRISLYVLYSIPIFFGTWFIGISGGFFFCLVAVAGWMTVDLQLHPWELTIVIWNAALRLIFFLAISTVVSSLKTTLDREKSQAGLDFLTQLPNRRTLLALGNRERQSAIRHNRPLTIAYVDLDDFKEINDRSGHDVGDLVLKEVASELRYHVRAADIAARIGGDEFVLLFPETGYEAAESALIKLKQSLKKKLQAKHWNVSVSIGAITYTDRFPELMEMIGTADHLMYQAKAAGKDRICHEIDSSKDCLCI